MKHKISTFIIAAALTLALGQMASAADLGRPVYSAPPVLPPPPTYIWTGCYIGGNVGGAWAHVEATDVDSGTTISPSNSGFAGGGQIGCDYQWDAWVVGIRDMFDGTSLNKSSVFSNSSVAGTVDSHLNWFDTLTGRVGYLVQPNFLLYGQGGAAWANWNVNFLNNSGVQVAEIGGNSDTGWTVGGGVEWMFVPHWSAFIEYNYTGFGNRSSTFTACGAATCANISAKENIQNVLLGVNFRF